MRSCGLLLGVGLVSFAPAAWSQSCSFTPQAGPIPAGVLAGQVAFDDKNTGAVYSYDFTSTTLTTVPMSGLSGGENPVYLPDGSAILFAAVSTVGGNPETDLFYWKIASAAQPVNITSAMGNHRDEDVKFSPDGNTIVWKQDIGIVTANFSLDGGGNPVVSNPPTTLVPRPPEASAPVFSPDQNYLYYFINNANPVPEQIERYDLVSKNTTSAFPQDVNVTYYYPAAPDLYNFMYVSRLPGAPCAACDKIYVGAKLPAPGTVWNAADCAVNNSDPAPVSADYFIYSRDNNDSQYQLYLGQISTGFAWSLQTLPGLSTISGSFVGANYTSHPH